MAKRSIWGLEPYRKILNVMFKWLYLENMSRERDNLSTDHISWSTVDSLLFVGSGGSRGILGLEPPLFWTINAFEWEHIVGTPPPPLFTLGLDPPPFFFWKWLDPPLVGYQFSWILWEQLNHEIFKELQFFYRLGCRLWQRYKIKYPCKFKFFSIHDN